MPLTISSPSPIRFGAEKKQLLVVDDNSILQTAHKRLLQNICNKENVDVYVAADRSAAKNALKSWNFDMVLLDNDMPNVNNPKVHKRGNTSDEGLKLLNFIGKMPADARPEVVVISAPTQHDEETLRATAKGRGAIDLITKPLNTKAGKNRLMEILQQYLGL